MFKRILDLMHINKERIKTFFSSKDVLIFLFFLLLSFLFWYLHSLRKNYEITFPVEVIYTNVPNEKVNEDLLTSTIQVSVKDQGFNLLTYKTKKRPPINIDIARDATEDQNNIYIGNDVLQTKLRDQLIFSSGITRLNPERIIIPVVDKSYKRIPVKFNGTISFAPQHNFSDSIKIEPSHVIVYGDKKDIDSITQINTEPTTLKEVKDTIRRDLTLQKIKGVQYTPEQVSLFIPVERFTEGTITIPVTGENFPPNISITYPLEITVKYNIPFSKSYAVNRNNITATIDYADVANSNNTGKIKPILHSNNPFIFNLRCVPEEVSFLLEHK